MLRIKNPYNAYQDVYLQSVSYGRNSVHQLGWDCEEEYSAT